MSREVRDESRIRVRTSDIYTAIYVAHLKRIYTLTFRAIIPSKKSVAPAKMKRPKAEPVSPETMSTCQVSGLSMR